MVTADNSTFAEDIAPDVLVLSRPDGFADVVLASAVLEPARKALPHAKIFLLIREKYAGIFCNHPALDGLIFLDEAAGLRALAKKLKAVRADALAHLAYSEFVADAAKLAKIRNVSAFEDDADADRDGGVTLEVIPSERHRETHEAFFNFEVLAPFGVPEADKPRLDVSPDPAEKPSAVAKLAQYGIAGTDYAVFNLDCNPQGHYVDPAVFSRAAKWLRGHAPMPIVVVGEKNDEATPRFLRFCRTTHGTPILDLRGQTTPAEAAWLLGGARLCLSGENACAYLAAAMHCPLVALFVDFSSGRWFPLGHLTTNIFTGAHRFFLEPTSFYNRRASRAFSDEKMASALQFALALRDAAGRGNPAAGTPSR